MSHIVSIGSVLARQLEPFVGRRHLLEELLDLEGRKRQGASEQFFRRHDEWKTVQDGHMAYRCKKYQKLHIAYISACAGAVVSRLFV